MEMASASGLGTGPALAMTSPPTVTSRDQKKAEQDVVGCFRAYLSQKPPAIRIETDRHVAWLERGLRQLPTNFAGLDASRPWFVFWISHALEVLGSFDEDVWAPQVASFLAHCQDPEGGFGGGPSQLPHLAPTYAAVAAILVAGTEKAWRVVDRAKTYAFLMRMKSPGGGFKMHDEGETDMRGTYCAVAVASMCHLLSDELTEGVAEYVRGCQTWEGGIAGEAGLEAHGGYSYCGLAALCIIGESHALDLPALLNWACHRQMGIEGGFQGRTNKLVDSCYAFWMGAIFPLLHEAFRQRGSQAPYLPEKHCWFMPQPLQAYVLLACQHPSGGLRDKPGKSADFYHTCYSLSGVATAQYEVDGTPCAYGEEGNQLQRVDPFYNVGLEKVERKTAYFSSLPPITTETGAQLHGQEGKGVAAARRHFLDIAGHKAS